MSQQDEGPFLTRPARDRELAEAPDHICCSVVSLRAMGNVRGRVRRRRRGTVMLLQSHRCC